MLKHPIILLIVVFIIIESIIFYQFGVRTSVDSTIYLGLAQKLSQGIFPEQHYWWYFSYIFFIFLFGGNTFMVVAVQVLISLFATICFYKLCHSIFQNSTKAVLASLFLILWVEIKGFDMYIYTESFFSNMIIISIWSFFTKPIWITSILISIATLSRPTGIFLPISFAVYGIYHYNEKFNKKLLILLISIFTVFIGLFLNFQLSTYTLIESYEKGEVIFPDINFGADVPNCLYIPDNKGSILSVLSFAFHNFWYFSKLTFTKFIFYIAHIKPWYSTLHNLLIVFTLYPIYAFSFLSIFRSIMNRKTKILFFSFIILNIICISLTSESWDGRFLIPVLPFFIVLAFSYKPKKLFFYQNILYQKIKNRF